ncbi:hypothetical protein Taro_034154 [Colocasia esculenta]|uniref:Beta-ketoacyl-[acyl-carrier-protein] synthase III C-terminal domain-containing protein n=1 Tax=Colocasia esculenta TaxID=4460 RepID=A0A843W6S3_COLES|nr:hypothetical protein [Colocasia esculenta]
MAIAEEALKSNITTIGPLVLLTSEQLLFLFTLIGRKIFNKKMKPYIPDFKQDFKHFCIHSGGSAIIEELQKNLDLSTEHIEASRMTLHRFGNTSSSSLWYELNYIESKGRMRHDDRVWQIAFGSGFKCNSVVVRLHPPLSHPHPRRREALDTRTPPSRTNTHHPSSIPHPHHPQKRSMHTCSNKHKNIMAKLVWLSHTNNKGYTFLHRRPFDGYDRSFFSTVS